MHAMRLYPQGARGAVRRRLRFMLSCLWWHRSAGLWFRHIQSTPALQQHVDAFPFIAGKPMTKYMRRSWRVRDRLACIMDHYRLMLSSPAGYRALALCGSGGTIATIRGRSDACYELVLACDAAQGREGEMVIELRKADRRVCCLCGSFSMVEERPVFMIGTMQGASGEDAKQLVREATKDLHQFRPRDVVIAAARTLASIFGAEILLAPDQKQHIHAGRRRACKIKADFNGLWTDLGGERGANGDFALPPEIHYRPAEAIASKRRAETLRRYTLKQQIAADIHAALG